MSTTFWLAQLPPGPFRFNAEKANGFDVDGGEESIEFVVGSDNAPTSRDNDGSLEEVLDLASLEGTDDVEQEGVISFGQQESAVSTREWNAIVGHGHAVVRRSARPATASGVRLR